MPGPKPAQGSRPRPGGGFNQGFGNFSDEHLNESAMQSAMQQKQMTQQAGQVAGSPNPAAKKTNNPAPSAIQKQQDRQIGTITEEVFKRPLADIVTSIKSIFDINALFNIDPTTDSPEEQAKKKQLHQRWQQLDQEQQRVVQEEFQRRMQKKQQEEQEELQKKQMEEQKKKEQVVMPSSPKKGPVGPASGKSNKQNMMDKMQMDRKTLSQGQGSG